MLVWIFTAVYFLIFCGLIYFIVPNLAFIGSVAAESIFSIVCWVIAFFISVGFGEYTDKKLKEHYTKK